MRIDRTPPIVALTTDGAPLIAPDGEWLSRAVRLRAEAADQVQLSGMVPAPAGGGRDERRLPRVSGRRRRAGARAHAGVTVDLPDDGLHVVTVRAVDAAGNVSDPQRATFRVDRNAPSGLVERTAATEPRRLRASVNEECIAAASLELRPTGARDWRTHAAQVERRAVTGIVPDDRLPAGEYTARFRVRDCAGNTGVLWYGTAVDPGRAAPPAARPAQRRRRGHRRRGRTAQRAHASASGMAVRISGRVTKLDGAFVPGRRVEFQDRIGAGEWKLRAIRVSDDTGQVAATLRAGPSRQIRLVVADTEQAIGAASRAVTIAVPARVTVRASRRSLRNGQAVRFSGRLLGGHVPRRGRELELQGYNPLRGRWQPVRTQGLRTSGTGRWTTTYRFTATVGATVTYRFRVRVAPRPDHPFAEGFSRVVAVTVRG